MADKRELSLLLQDCARHDDTALAELYQRTSAHLFALAARMLRNDASAEEVLQESFIAVWRRAGQYRADQSQPMTWLISIVRNRCIDRLRRPDFILPDLDGSLAAEWADEAPGPLARLQAHQDSSQLADCLKQLEAAHRQAIALSFFDDLAHPEIAERLQAPLGTVKSWLRRGMQKLKRCME